ncbi:MAG: FAD-binding protein [Haliea sp.]|nr:FAD-binding protein [Haliea sp.]
MIGRRQLITALVSAAVGSQFYPGLALAQGEAPKRRIPWRNWSGSQQCLPAARKAPGSLQELQELVASTAGTIRPVGSGHSFSPLVPTDGTLFSLSRLSGVMDHNPEQLQATLWGGSRLGDIGQPLEDVGQALVNMPDIDEQSLAGSLATATHGTGAGIGCLSDMVVGLQLMDSKGDLHDCDAATNADLFQAARVSLGALGFVTQVRMQNMAPYLLEKLTVWREFDEILALADELADTHRNFEFFYIPFSGMGWTDVHDLTDKPLGATEKFDFNDGAGDLKLVRDWLESFPKLRELILGTYMGTIEDEATIASSWKNYANERNVRFNEMEYHLPREHGLQALREVREALESQHQEVFFPIEVRFVKGDDIWLSPFYQRDTCSIAVHRYFEEDFQPYFRTIEPILRKYQGRPHWGKLNTLAREDFRKLYPRWDDFEEVRRAFDPEGRFLNTYLAGLFNASG